VNEKRSDVVVEVVMDIVRFSRLRLRSTSNVDKELVLLVSIDIASEVKE